MSNKKSWDKRYQIIKKNYPNINDDTWISSFDNDDTFIKILGDVLKSERRVSTPGKRPGLSKSDGMERLNKILERDFSDLDFTRAFKALTVGKSVRSITAKTGLSKSHVQRLLSGEDNPSIESMEKIADGFKKHPSYFLEYRIYKILASVNYILVNNPETATNLYSKIRGI